MKDYLEAVRNHCIFKFGEDREKALIEGKSKFLKDVQESRITVSQQLDDLIVHYVTSFTLGYDRMRKKGDPNLFKKAQEIETKIKALCPWE